jgi:hypothetical protein
MLELPQGRRICVRVSVRCSNPSYKGADEVSYEVNSASGKVENHSVRITVKEETPADAKPNSDTDTKG